MEHPKKLHPTPLAAGDKTTMMEDPVTALTTMLGRGLRLRADGLVDRSVEVVTIDERSRRDSDISQHSTHPISRLRLTLTSGRRLDVILKRLRPQPGKDVCREVLTYRRLLADGRFGAPRLYASVCDDAHERYWLLLEYVGKCGLDRCGVDERVAAVRWAARMHATYYGRPAKLRDLGCLGEHGPQFYDALMSAARLRLTRWGEPAASPRFDRLMARFHETVEFLDTQPRTLIHGDLSDSNVFVQRNGRWRIRPIDWEWAAIGVGAWDLDKLLAGRDSAKPRLQAAYLDEFARQTGAPLDTRALETMLAHCAIVRMLWNLGCPSPPPRGVRWDNAGINQLLDQIAVLQERAADG